MPWKAPYRPSNEITQDYNDGLVEICTVTDAAEPGRMPVERLALKIKLCYEERSLGLQRYYSGKQNQVEVQRVIRTPRRKEVSSQDVAVTEDGVQYRIDLVQPVIGVYPPSMDLTLTRIEQNCDVSNLDTKGILPDRHDLTRAQRHRLGRDQHIGGLGHVLRGQAVKFQVFFGHAGRKGKDLCLGQGRTVVACVGRDLLAADRTQNRRDGCRLDRLIQPVGIQVNLGQKQVLTVQQHGMVQGQVIASAQFELHRPHTDADLGKQIAALGVADRRPKGSGLLPGTAVRLLAEGQQLHPLAQHSGVMLHFPSPPWP